MFEERKRPRPGDETLAGDRPPEETGVFSDWDNPENAQTGGDTDDWDEDAPEGWDDGEDDDSYVPDESGSGLRPVRGGRVRRLGGAARPDYPAVVDRRGIVAARVRNPGARLDQDQLSSPPSGAIIASRYGWRSSAALPLPSM
jgi:hypothetical protein